MPTDRQHPVTVPGLIEFKRRGDKIAALTAYDYSFARLLDDAGIDVVLVGDSAAQVSAGRESTLPLTMDEALYHARMVRRGVRSALLVADMPFLSYQVSPEEALRNAGRFFKEAEVDAVKLEGGATIATTVQRLVQAGMPVMGHIGLTPQSVRRFGGYPLQGKEEGTAELLRVDAEVLQQAGIFALVLEKIPAELARRITAAVEVPTIGIGAGPHCDGQILVTYDMLGLFEEFRPKFVRRYADLAAAVRQACGRYGDEVRSGAFPGSEESY
ncbi:MAG TPA: 3-methyl-2-oxobutanoate hydroxymethyltransferase [bacterium]|nr:3-methyl-2-oxobutanoate hydroxymethyltransferase [bacterium]HPR88726.1 3-methyl-2-oxobutanoate hydroxymethyltransferase [bacterium]